MCWPWREVKWSGGGGRKRGGKQIEGREGRRREGEKGGKKEEGERRREGREGERRREGRENTGEWIDLPLSSDSSSFREVFSF